MLKTGIFYHYQQGERLKDFPEALGNILSYDEVLFYDARYERELAYGVEPVKEELLTRVHSKQLIERVKKTGDYLGALYSAGGTVQAVERIFQGEIARAFVFTGFGDHHAGRDFFGGGCYFNGAALAIANADEKFSPLKFAIIDTDAHHGNGSWDIFKDNERVLYFCLCSGGNFEEGNNINIKVPFHTSDEQYLAQIEEQFVPKVADFKPDLLLWNFGYDGTQGDYGDIGLSRDCHGEIARILTRTAQDICQGRLAVVLCGGSRRDMARYIIPQVISNII
jgi:acetoin utilization deacetylase AcuC-like enzyme